MGCCFSKSEDAQVADTAFDGNALLMVASSSEVLADFTEQAAEFLVEEVQFSIGSLPNINPSLKAFSKSKAVGWLKEVVNGAEFKISITALIEFACRCFMNSKSRE